MRKKATLTVSLLSVMLATSGLIATMQYPVQAGWLRDFGKKIDPTNPNSRVRETLRNTDPTTGDIYVNNNSSSWIRVEVRRSNATTLGGLLHHFVLAPNEQNVLIEDNIGTGEYGLSATEIDASNNVIVGGKVWNSQWVELRSRGLRYSFN